MLFPAAPHILNHFMNSICMTNISTCFKADLYMFYSSYYVYRCRSRNNLFSISFLTELLSKDAHKTVERVNVQGKPKNDSLVYLREKGSLLSFWGFTQSLPLLSPLGSISHSAHFTFNIKMLIVLSSLLNGKL